MHVSLVGVNHRTAPITIREQMAITTEQLHDALSLLRHGVPHGIILSTCNRTEVYTTSSDDLHPEEASINFLEAHLNLQGANLRSHVYVYQDEAAVEYLFRVASGLDSMIIGEFEVLGQVGQALEVAEKAGMVNLRLRHIFQSAVRAGRRVREETGISKNALSVSSVAVDLAADVLGDLTNCRILVIGTGEAGRLVAKAARERGVSQITVASRSQERAKPLAAALGGTPISMNNLATELSSSHLVISSTGASHRILHCSQVEEAMMTRHELPLVIIDIAVPRDVEPAVGYISNVFLFNIDDLTQICDLNRKQREGEIQAAMEIVADEVARFTSWWQALKARPVVSALMKKAENIRRAQLNRTLQKLPSLSDEERNSLEAMTKSIVTKILKDPVSYLKTNANNKSDSAEMISELFQLDTEKRG